MKKIFPFFLLVLLLASCQKDPDMSKLDNDFLVFTNHDKDAKFESFTTFYIPDSVLVIGTSEKPQFWTANEADDIITPGKLIRIDATADPDMFYRFKILARNTT